MINQSGSAYLAFNPHSTILNHRSESDAMSHQPTYRKLITDFSPPVPFSFQYTSNELLNLIPNSHRRLTWSHLSSLVSQPYGSLFKSPSQVTFNKSMLSSKLPTFLTQINLLPSEYYKSLFTSSEFDPKGNYNVIAQVRGEYKVVTVDDRVPVHCETGRPLYQMEAEAAPWAIILLKVWAYINGGYDTLMYCQPYEFLRTFTYPNWKMRILKSENRESLYDDLRTMVPCERNPEQQQQMSPQPSSTPQGSSQIRPTLQHNSIIKNVVSKIVTGNVTTSGNVVTDSGKVVGKQQVKREEFQRQDSSPPESPQKQSIIPVSTIPSGDILRPPPGFLPEEGGQTGNFPINQTFQPMPLQQGQLPPSSFQPAPFQPPFQPAPYQPNQNRIPNQYQSMAPQMMYPPPPSQLPQQPPPKSALLQPYPPIFPSQLPNQIRQGPTPIPQPGIPLSRLSPAPSVIPGSPIMIPSPPGSVRYPMYTSPSKYGQPYPMISGISNVSGAPMRVVGPQFLNVPDGSGMPMMPMPPSQLQQMQAQGPSQLSQQAPSRIPAPPPQSNVPRPPPQFLPPNFQSLVPSPQPSGHGSINQPFFPSLTSNYSEYSAVPPQQQQYVEQKAFQSQPFANQKLPIPTQSKQKSVSNELELSRSDGPDYIREMSADMVGSSYFPKTGSVMHYRKSEVVEMKQPEKVMAGPHSSNLASYGTQAHQVFTIIAKTKDNDKVRSYGLQPNCASYKIVHTFQANRQFLLKISTSLNHNWNGRYSVYDPTLNSIYNQQKYNLSLNRSFLITLDDFLEIFSHLMISSIDYTNITGVKHTFKSVQVPQDYHKAQQFYLKVTRPCVLDLSVVQNTQCQKDEIRSNVIYHRFLRTKLVLARERERGRGSGEGTGSSVPHSLADIADKSRVTPSKINKQGGISITLPPAGSEVSIGIPDGNAQTIINIAGGITDIQLPNPTTTAPPPTILQKSRISQPQSLYQHMLIKQTSGMSQNQTFQGIFNQGNYVLLIKRQPHHQKCQYTLHIVSSAPVELAELRMSKEEKSAVMRSVVLDYCQKYVKNKRYMTDERKKGFCDWLCYRPGFEEFGFGFLVVMAEEFSHNKVICKFNPRELEASGFICKGIYKGRNQDIELISQRGQGQVILFKRLNQTISIPSGFQLFLQTK